MSMVSVIIVNYNGVIWLKNCLSTLVAQTHKEVEIILVDNASSDDSVAFVRGNFPSVNVYENTWNAGFAGGNNFGLQYATGDFILLLNTDTQVTPTFISDLLVAFQENPKLGCVQPKLIFMHDTTKLDSCGSYFSSNGFLKHIGNQQLAIIEEYNKPFPVLSVKGACMMFRRDVLEKVGGLFDESFWCYFEETDFCLRLWLAGYECWYYPKSVIYHAMGGTVGTFFKEASQYHSAKNRLTAYLTIFSWQTLARMLPIYLFLNITLGIFLAVIGQWTNAASMFRGIGFNIKNFGTIYAKRKKIQHNIRVVRDRDFLPALTRPANMIGMLKQVWYLITYERHMKKPIDTSVVS